MRRALLVGKNRINLYFGSSISGDTCDKIITWDKWRLPGGISLPVTMVTETLRPYTLTQEVRSEEEALRLADLTLTKQLARAMEDGKVLSRSLSAEVRGDTLLVTLSAECEEQVGRLVELP